MGFLINEYQGTFAPSLLVIRFRNESLSLDGAGRAARNSTERCWLAFNSKFIDRGMAIQQGPFAGFKLAAGKLSVSTGVVCLLDGG